MIHLTNPPGSLYATFARALAAGFSGGVSEPESTATPCLKTISPPNQPEIVIKMTPSTERLKGMV
jgi:hypothetical protein